MTDMQQISTVPNVWVDTASGMTYIGRDGQTLESILAEREASLTAPAPPAPIAPLEPWRFKAVVSLAFPPPEGGQLLDGLKAAIVAAITDPVQQAVALAMLESPPGGLYSIDNPLFSDASLMAATGKTAADIQSMWQQGLKLPDIN
jgi:hypothetical protein